MISILINKISPVFSMFAQIMPMTIIQFAGLLIDKLSKKTGGYIKLDYGWEKELFF